MFGNFGLQGILQMMGVNPEDLQAASEKAISRIDNFEKKLDRILELLEAQQSAGILPAPTNETKESEKCPATN